MLENIVALERITLLCPNQISLALTVSKLSMTQDLSLPSGKGAESQPQVQRTFTVTAPQSFKWHSTSLPAITEKTNYLGFPGSFSSFWRWGTQWSF